jgi:hypothetical protein
LEQRARPNAKAQRPAGTTKDERKP